MNNITRQEDWGSVIYRPPESTFVLKPNPQLGHEVPASSLPLVCNLILTVDCNLVCPYCYARDITAGTKEGLIPTLSKLRETSFMEIVLSGGEPLLVQSDVMLCIKKLEGKGIVIDTNGTIDLNDKLRALIRTSNVALRVSIDAPCPEMELPYRRSKHDSDIEIERRIYEEKIERIKELVASGIRVSVQTVVHDRNIASLEGLGRLIVKLGVSHWFLQPIRTFPMPKEDRKEVDAQTFEQLGHLLHDALGKSLGIHEKRDVRSNSVFLCDRDGFLYTQAENVNIKIKLGHLSDLNDFFSYVSRTDHTLRYASLLHGET